MIAKALQAAQRPVCRGELVIEGREATFHWQLAAKKRVGKVLPLPGLFPVVPLRSFGGLHICCTYYSEEGYVCTDPGAATNAQVVNVNGIELARFDYSSGRGTKTTLCGRNVPQDYNEGPISDDIQFRREAINESQTPGEFVFSGDPALHLDMNKTLVRSQGTTALIAQGSRTGSEFRWTLANLVDSPSLSNVRFGTAMCEGRPCGGETDEGQRFSGLTQVIVINSALGERVYRAGGSPLVLLPNGSVDDLQDFLCQEYPGMDPRPTSAGGSP